MVATLTILTVATILPQSNKAMADDGDQLYCIAGNGTKLRPYTGTGKVTDINNATVYYAGAPVSATYAKINGEWKPIIPSTCTVSDLIGISTPNSGDWNGKDLGTIDSHTAIGYGRSVDNTVHHVGIDNDGRLWFKDWDSKDNESWSHTADTYRFSHITSAAYNPNTTQLRQDFDGTLLLGHRISDTTQAAQVMQMPTTGAPEGLTTFGLTAVGLGLAGLAFALVRRRS